MNQPGMARQWRKQIILPGLLLMITGLMVSRMLLTIGMSIFLVSSLLDKNAISQLKKFYSGALTLSILLLFFIPFISGLWSEDKESWSQIIRIKLPLLLLPAGFAMLENFDSANWRKLAWTFIALTFSACCWSMTGYLQDANAIHAGYLRSQTIVTALGNDHVRFSLLVSLSIFTCIYLLVEVKELSLSIKIFLATLILGFILFLHVLAVRTGLVCFYLSALLWLVWSTWRKHNFVRNFILLIILASLPVLAYFLFPTFQNRLRYFNYDISFAKKNVYLPGSNDGTRLLSLKGGLAILEQHPVTGVGFGDVNRAMKDWYETQVPEMKDGDKILPSSEWIVHGAGTGWPGVLLLTVALIVPLFTYRGRSMVFWWIMNLSLMFSYLFDNGLEGQYGVFIHVFILCWWWHWLKIPTAEN